MELTLQINPAMTRREFKECCPQFSLLSLHWNKEIGFFLSVEALISNNCFKIKYFLFIYAAEAP